MTAHLPHRLEVYLDLDGVFADFEGRVRRLSGKHPDQLPPARMWKLINADPRFFADLELIEGCMALWEATRDLEPIFLTGAPGSRVFQEQKREWVARVFGPEYTVHVVPRRRKRDFAAPHPHRRHARQHRRLGRGGRAGHFAPARSRVNHCGAAAFAGDASGAAGLANGRFVIISTMKFM